MTVRNNKVMMMSNRVTSTFAISALAISMVAVSNSAHAAQRINNVSVVQTAPAVTQIRLGFAGVPVLPAAYQLDDPSRLVLDFEQVQNGLASRFSEYNIGMVNDVTTLSSDSTTRLIVGLKQTGTYTTTIDGNDLVLTITDPSRSLRTNDPVQDVLNNTITTTPIVETSSAYTAVDTTNKTVAKNQVPADTMVVRVNPLLSPQLAASQVSKQYSYDGLSAVNFAAGKDGGGNVSIALTNEAIPVDVQRQGNKLVVNLTGSTVPRNLLRRLNINSGLVNSIDTKNQGQNGVITINMTEDYEYQAYQSGNQLNISINKPALLREPTLEERVYSGEPLSMEFQDVEIRSVLDILAQFTEMNIVANDSVSGNITLRLINVPWDQALDIILKSKNLGKRENGNVILVAPATELAEQEAKELEAQQAVDSYLPLRTEYIRLSYAKAQDVLTLISQGSGSSGGSNNGNSSDSNSLLSNRGTVTVDNRTNTLIIKDVADSIENIHRLIGKIDIPVRQVMIEARIVSASDSFSKEIGVSWGILFDGEPDDNRLTSSGLNVDLGISNPASVAFGVLNVSDVMLDLELSAMQADNRGEVISTPKILTADKQTAKISSGTQIGYQEASASGATTTSFIEAALSLEATPNITPDGKISLKLDVKNGSPTIYNGAVAIDEDSITTNIIVEDGQTVVLGGVFKNRIANGVEKVPFLGDLPYVGRLFRTDTRSNEKEELLIFITTKLINDGVSRLD